MMLQPDTDLQFGSRSRLSFLASALPSLKPSIYLDFLSGLIAQTIETELRSCRYVTSEYLFLSLNTKKELCEE